MMSIKRLRMICKTAVDMKPDLVILTGDYFTAEAHGGKGTALKEALEPLKAMRNRTFACLGVPPSFLHTHLSLFTLFFSFRTTIWKRMLCRW
jgi:hypothetical protein